MSKTKRAARKSRARSRPAAATSHDETPPDNSGGQAKLQELDPKDYMLGVMRDPAASPVRRDAMAKSLTPYLHSRVAPSEAPTDAEAALRKRMEEARESVRRKLARLRSEAG